MKIEFLQAANHRDLRVYSLLVSLGGGVLFLLLSSLIISPCENPASDCSDRFIGDLVLDRSVDFNSVNPDDPSVGIRNIYPLTVQNIMWIMFFFGLGEVALRLYLGAQERDQLVQQYLPEDSQTMLRAQDLGPIYQNVRSSSGRRDYYLQRLIARSILQFQSSRSVDQTNSLLNSNLELFIHEIDLKFGMLRYLVWLIPTLGFIGTVIGIALALNVAGDVPNIADGADVVRPWMKRLTASLSVAFYTTLLALLMSAILVFLLQIAQTREEMALNRAGQYCLDNLIIRLYEK